VSEDPNAPDVSNLKFLKEMLPSLIKGLAEKKAIGRGKRVAPRRPWKCCAVCCDIYEYKESFEEVTLENGHCPKCDGLLKEGYVAFVSGDKFAFGKSDRLKDKAGEVMAISLETMAKLEKQFTSEWKKNKNGNNDEGTPPVAE